MRYRNPIISGFYPDPSVINYKGHYFLVCSSFQYNPGVPLFESDDLVNWKLIGHVLTRKSQLKLKGIRSSGGIFAPSIREHNGRFYMITNDNSADSNFYVWTDDIYGEWSDPVYVEQKGIDPSLFFDDDGRCYLQSNGTDVESGKGVVIQSEIDIATGKRLSDEKVLWAGTGGRYIESPHLYKIGEYYYLMAAEGGTEYGHMITYARSSSVWGSFEGYAGNPVLTNRNKAPYIIQGCGHGDLVKDVDGRWFVICLGFRQIGEWMPYHHLGREVFMAPVDFDDEGWFRAGADGTMDEYYTVPDTWNKMTDPDINDNIEYTFSNTRPGVEWCFLRDYSEDNYELDPERFVLTGTAVSLDDVGSPTFIAMRQREFVMDLKVSVEFRSFEPDVCDEDQPSYGETGITLYMSENEHYELAISDKGCNGRKAVLKLRVGDACCVSNEVELPEDVTKCRLMVSSDNYRYYFSIDNGDAAGIKELGSAQTRYLSSEVSGGFTGVMTGLYAVGNVKAEFTDYTCRYTRNVIT